MNPVRFARPFLALVVLTGGCNSVPGVAPGLAFTPPTTEEIQAATWALSALVPTDQGPRLLVVGSGFAIDANRIATNAHVVDALGYVAALGKAYNLGISLVAVQHETGDQRPLATFWMHPAYSPDDPTKLGTPDLGLIRVQGDLPIWLSLANSDTAQAVQVFDHVSMCGFPGDVELIFEAAAGSLRPRATCLQGTITALRPFNPSDAASAQNTQLIQHDIPTSPGTSGSPILNDRGEVIAVNFAGTTDDSASNRFAIRADLLTELIAMVDSGMSGLSTDALGNSIVIDSDGDGLLDSDEIALGTDPASRDTDGDGLADPTEITQGTDPTKWDTDGDGLNDGFESLLITDPLVFNQTGLVLDVLCRRFATAIGVTDAATRVLYIPLFTPPDFSNGVSSGDLVVFLENGLALVVTFAGDVIVCALHGDLLLGGGSIVSAVPDGQSVRVTLSSGFSYRFNAFDDAWLDWRIGDRVIIDMKTVEGTDLWHMVNRDACEDALLSVP